MPELPEVESVRRSLLPHVRGRRLVSAILHRRDVLIAPGDPPGGFPRQRAGKRARPVALRPGDLLEHATIIDIRRRGKQLAIISRTGHALGVQLGMSGTLELVGSDEPADKHSHAVWTLDSGVRFRFHDPRRFGALRVFRSLDDLAAHWSTLGPDALTITADQLHAALATAQRPIKTALLDQQVLAGVGNIYADESLFLARINPRIKARRLSPDQVASLANAIRSVLAQSIDAGGSTLRDYSDADGRAGSYQSRHAVYGRGGLPCPVCSRPLSSGLLAQRTTVWCATCQLLRSSARRPRR